jgi:hypothetical protein
MTLSSLFAPIVSKDLPTTLFCLMAETMAKENWGFESPQEEGWQNQFTSKTVFAQSLQMV